MLLLDVHAKLEGRGGAKLALGALCGAKESSLTYKVWPLLELEMSQQALTKLVADSRGSILASNPAAHGTIIGIPNDFSLDVAEIY